MRIQVPVVCALLLAGAAPVAAQQSPVTLSFRALTDGGAPVLDLKAADITVKIDGKARTVKSLDLVTIKTGAGPTSAPANPAFTTNLSNDTARELIFVVDDESITPGKEMPLREALRQVVNLLSPTDRVGILSLRTGGTSIGATSDRARINAVIDGLKGEARQNESLEDFQCRTSQILTSLKGLFEGATDAKTTFVIVSSGLAPLPSEAVQTMGRSSGLCPLRAQHFSDVGQAAAGSPAAAYVIFAIDGRMPPLQNAQAGLESVAGVTSAPFMRLAGDTVPNAQRIAHETAAYYVAKVDVEPGERNGAVHKADVRASRGGVKIKSGTALTLSNASAKVQPKDLIRSAETYRDLPLRATAWPMRDAGNKVKVMALFEPVDAGVKLTSAMIGLIDGTRIAAQWTAQSGELEKAPMLAALLAAPGKYRMRVAAVDSTGRAGTVDYPLDAQLVPAGTMTMSGLTIGLADNGFKPRLLFAPQDQGALGYLEVYGVPKGASVTGLIELAPSEQAPPIATTPATVQNASSEDMRIVVGGFSIGGLAPGDYVMRMVISVDGKVAGTAMRTMSKEK
ncbi:MAG TPA: hypothetical protein VF147_04150 [Vicinamibacterales bacterium]